MENKKSDTFRKAVAADIKEIKSNTDLKTIITTVLMLMAFLFYALTFFVPKFYGFTEDYVGVFIFVILAGIFFTNVNPIKKIKEKDVDLIVLAVLAILVILNIFLVDSGKGCFFVAVNFAMIFYLAGEIKFQKWQIHLFGTLYVAMLLYWFMFVYTWMFADYSSFAMNTNTAATFTVFSMLVAFVLFESVFENHKYIGGLLITIALVKCFQLSLYHRSRGAFIMLMVFALLKFVVPKKWWEKKGFFTFMSIFATFGSLLFVAFYVWLGTTGVNFSMPFFYKNIFSGREAIWYEFWTLFKNKPLTGIGTNVTITSFFEFNVHNAMYNILVIHGVLVFAATIFLMYRRFFRCREGLSQRPVARCAAAAVFAVCIESFFDVDLIWANYSLNIFFLLLVMNNRYNFKKSDEQQ